jgi:hypothetical protein
MLASKDIVKVIHKQFRKALKLNEEGSADSNSNLNVYRHVSRLWSLYVFTRESELPEKLVKMRFASDPQE